MDGQTDEQNSDSNTVHCITCSRMVKMMTYTDNIGQIPSSLERYLVKITFIF